MSPSARPSPEEAERWYVLRDFSQGVRDFACLRFERAGFRVFTPMAWRLAGRGGERVLAPFVRDLFFAYSTRSRLDEAVSRSPEVTYRYVRGGYLRAMTVPSAEMERFILAARSAADPVYYRAGEVTPEMYGRRVRIHGGRLDGYEGSLLESGGGRDGKWLLVELPGFFSVGVRVQPRYVTFVD